MANIQLQMVAAYQVTIRVDRAEAELRSLDEAVRMLGRTLLYKGRDFSATRDISGGEYQGRGRAGYGAGQIFASFLERMQGRIQPQVQRAMQRAMNDGVKFQREYLEEAVTDWGSRGRPGSKRGPGKGSGRNQTGAMIKAISRNVEVQRAAKSTTVTGWHGWNSEAQQGARYFRFQEAGTRGSGRHLTAKQAKSAAAAGKGRSGGPIPAANSLGLSIPRVREALRKEMKEIAS